ncbi:MAG TPA: hypothetical protein VGJ30_01145 [Candidatus Angelobacter sp.]|jgi:hypothetical protein
MPVSQRNGYANRVNIQQQIENGLGPDGEIGWHIGAPPGYCHTWGLRNGVIVSKKMRRNTTQGMQRQTAGNLVHFFSRQLASATTIQYSVRHKLTP